MPPPARPRAVLGRAPPGLWSNSLASDLDLALAPSGEVRRDRDLNHTSSGTGRARSRSRADLSSDSQREIRIWSMPLPGQPARDPDLVDASPRTAGARS